MTTPRALCIFPEPASDAVLAGREEQLAGQSPALPIVAVAFSAFMHLAILGSASVIQVMNARRGMQPPIGMDNVLHVVFIALVLAQCGLVAVFLARCLWPLYLKAVAGSIVLWGLWLLLSVTLESLVQTPIGAGAWATCLILEAVLVWLFVTAIEMTLNYDLVARRLRFRILHLLILTTLIAVGFGAARIWAVRNGYELVNIPSWIFYWPIQLAGFVNAILTICLYATFRLARNWPVRLALAAVPLIAIVVAAPLIFKSLFPQQTSLTELRWLFGSEGLFLIATLVPMEVLRGHAHILK